MLPDAVSIKPQVPVHSIASHKLRSVDYKEDPQYMESVEHVLQQITSVLALESVVTHYELGYTGTFDCVVNYRFVPICVECCLVSIGKSTYRRECPTQVYNYI